MLNKRCLPRDLVRMKNCIQCSCETPNEEMWHKLKEIVERLGLTVAYNPCPGYGPVYRNNTFHIAEQKYHNRFCVLVHEFAHWLGARRWGGQDKAQFGLDDPLPPHVSREGAEVDAQILGEHLALMLLASLGDISEETRRLLL